MARFDSINYMELTTDGGALDIFSSRFKNLRFNVPTEKTIILTDADECNLPGLAYTYLGDESLGWALLEFNGLYDSIKDLKAGVRINIPNRRELITFLETQPDVTSQIVI